MRDRELVEQFEACTLPPDLFSHRAHVRVAWLYLKEGDLLPTLTRYSEGIKRYAASLGAGTKYHETITWAYLVLLNEEMSLRSPPGESFDDMVLRRPDLLDHRNGAIAQCYTRAELDADDARRVFVLPRTTAR